ncbi:hypothetical protein [uncultured Hyphomicrobium sp.]|uniref:hypothetical protein n=1 Tax=uncultured Hyphomicrobium sp. TaxID=194373 RepID=UPI0025CC10F1|nr:hypothetical protein [uncultured Hyphomicrobium sp.]
MHKSSALLLAVSSAALLAGCSSSGGGLFGSNPLTTQSISTSPSAPAVAAAPKVDPACYSIAQRIETLRRDGLTERLEKAAAGKSANVSVKRASLQQAAELDKANAEFQAKCSAFGPRPMQAAVAPISPAGTAAAPPVVNSAQVVPATAPPVVQQR